MPTDIALHPLGNPLQGNHPPAPPMPPLGGQTSLAEATNSADIVVPKTGGVLILQATVKARVAILQSEDGVGFPGGAPGNPDAAGSGVVLNADQPRLFSLPGGRFRLRTAVYA